MPYFALGRPEKCRSEGPKRAKTSLLRSKGQHEDKNVDFVLEKPKNLTIVAQKRTKWALLSSKAPKMAVRKGKKGQKPQFCPRKAQKPGKSCPKKDKMGTFVLKSTEKGGSEGKQRTKSPLLSSGRRKITVEKPGKTVPEIHLPHL